MKILKKSPSAKQRILQALCDEWPRSIPLFDLIKIGGTCAYRRIKELQDKHGIKIDFHYEIINDRRTDNTRYYLLPHPKFVDIKNLCLRS